jgi:phage pi2 protein 07
VSGGGGAGVGGVGEAMGGLAPFARVDSLIAEDRLRASIEVYNELERKDDELFAWCKERRETLFVEIDDDIQTIVKQVLLDHPRLVDTVKGRSGADPL